MSEFNFKTKIPSNFVKLLLKDKNQSEKKEKIIKIERLSNHIDMNWDWIRNINFSEKNQQKEEDLYYKECNKII